MSRDLDTTALVAFARSAVPRCPALAELCLFMEMSSDWLLDTYAEDPQCIYQLPAAEANTTIPKTAWVDLIRKLKNLDAHTPGSNVNQPSDVVPSQPRPSASTSSQSVPRASAAADNMNESGLGNPSTPVADDPIVTDLEAKQMCAAVIEALLSLRADMKKPNSAQLKKAPSTTGVFAREYNYSKDVDPAVFHCKITLVQISVSKGAALKATLMRNAKEYGVVKPMNFMKRTMAGITELVPHSIRSSLQKCPTQDQEPSSIAATDEELVMEDGAQEDSSSLESDTSDLSISVTKTLIVAINTDGIRFETWVKLFSAFKDFNENRFPSGLARIAAVFPLAFLEMELLQHQHVGLCFTGYGAAGAIAACIAKQLILNNPAFCDRVMIRTFAAPLFLFNPLSAAEELKQCKKFDFVNFIEESEVVSLAVFKLSEYLRRNPHLTETARRRFIISDDTFDALLCQCIAGSLVTTDENPVALLTDPLFKLANIWSELKESKPSVIKSALDLSSLANLAEMTVLGSSYFMSKNPQTMPILNEEEEISAKLGKMLKNMFSESAATSVHKIPPTHRGTLSHMHSRFAVPAKLEIASLDFVIDISEVLIQADSTLDGGKISFLGTNVHGITSLVLVVGDNTLNFEFDLLEPVQNIQEHEFSRVLLNYDCVSYHYSCSTDSQWVKLVERATLVKIMLNSLFGMKKECLNVPVQCSMTNLQISKWDSKSIFELVRSGLMLTMLNFDSVDASNNIITFKDDLKTPSHSIIKAVSWMFDLCDLSTLLPSMFRYPEHADDLHYFMCEFYQVTCFNIDTESSLAAVISSLEQFRSAIIMNPKRYMSAMAHCYELTHGGEKCTATQVRGLIEEVFAKKAFKSIFFDCYSGLPERVHEGDYHPSPYPPTLASQKLQDLEFSGRWLTALIGDTQLKFVEYDQFSQKIDYSNNTVELSGQKATAASLQQRAHLALARLDRIVNGLAALISGSLNSPVLINDAISNYTGWKGLLKGAGSAIGGVLLAPVVGVATALLGVAATVALPFIGLNMLKEMRNESEDISAGAFAVTASAVTLASVLGAGAFVPATAVGVVIATISTPAACWQALRFSDQVLYGHIERLAFVLSNLKEDRALPVSSSSASSLPSQRPLKEQIGDDYEQKLKIVYRGRLAAAPEDRNKVLSNLLTEHIAPMCSKKKLNSNQARMDLYQLTFITLWNCFRMETIRSALSGSGGLGLMGAKNAGKSTLVRYLSADFSIVTGSITAASTVVVRAYHRGPVRIIDFPSYTDPLILASTQCAIHSDLVARVCFVINRQNFDGKDAQEIARLLAANVSVMVCLNQSERFWGDKYAEMRSAPPNEICRLLAEEAVKRREMIAHQLQNSGFRNVRLSMKNDDRLSIIHTSFWRDDLNRAQHIVNGRRTISPTNVDHCRDCLLRGVKTTESIQLDLARILCVDGQFHPDFLHQCLYESPILLGSYYKSFYALTINERSEMYRKGQMLVSPSLCKIVSTGVYGSDLFEDSILDLALVWLRSTYGSNCPFIKELESVFFRTDIAFSWREHIKNTITNRSLGVWYAVALSELFSLTILVQTGPNVIFHISPNQTSTIPDMNRVVSAPFELSSESIILEKIDSQNRFFREITL